jgi:uncharacterized protein (DUF433 family)
MTDEAFTGHSNPFPCLPAGRPAAPICRMLCYNTSMKTQDYITVDAEVCHGKPCFKGTRIMVSIVLELLEAGESVSEIIENYPALTPLHIQAALHLAHEMLSSDRYIVFPAA